MPKSVGSREHCQGNGSIVCNVDEQAGRHGILSGSHRRQHQADEEDDQHRSPSEHQLRAVQQGEGKRGQQNRGSHTETAVQHWIKEGAKIEVTHIAGKQMTPDGVEIENPAFDVTPAKYVAAIITERGIARAPYEESLSDLATELPKHP